MANARRDEDPDFGAGKCNSQPISAGTAQPERCTDQASQCSLVRRAQYKEGEDGAVHRL